MKSMDQALQELNEAWLEMAQGINVFGYTSSPNSYQNEAWQAHECAMRIASKLSEVNTKVGESWYRTDELLEKISVELDNSLGSLSNDIRDFIVNMDGIEVSYIAVLKSIREEITRVANELALGDITHGYPVSSEQHY